MGTIRLVTVAGNPDREAAIAEEVARDSRCELVLRCLERTELLAAIRAGRLDLVVVVGAPAWLDLPAMAEVREHQIRVVGFAEDPLEAEAFRRLGIALAAPGAGIRDVVIRDGLPENEPVVPGPPRRCGRTVAVWGPKGAPGRSTIASELAAEMAAADARTALIDADTYGGDLAQMLAVVEELPTIVWAAQAAAEGTLDEHTLCTMLRRAGAGGPVLLPGINRSELWTDITKYGWSRLLETFAACFSFTVVDVGFGLEHDERLRHERDRLARDVVGSADHVIAVCRADPVGIKTFLWSFERLKELRDPDDIFVVANRVVAGEADEIRYILKKHLGRRPLVCVPERRSEVRTAIERGVTLREMKPNSDVASEIRELASALGAKIPARGLLTRLGGRS